MATFAATNFITASDITGKVNVALLLRRSKNAPDIDSIVQSCITNSKDQYLRQPLLNELQKRFPDTVQRWLTEANSLREKSIRQIRAQLALIDENSIVPPVGYVGTFIGNTFTTNAFPTTPATWYSTGAPIDGVSGTNPKALNGARNIDTLNEVLYINRSVTVDSPAWVRTDSFSLLDYILNPTELKWVAYYAALLVVVEFGETQNMVNYQEPINVNFIEGKRAEYWEFYKSSLKAALPLTNIDESGDGIIQDYERAIGRRIRRWG